MANSFKGGFLRDDATGALVVSGASGSSSAARLQGPDGAPAAQSLDLVRLTTFVPEALGYGGDQDNTLLFDRASELEMMRAGGVLSGDKNNTLSPTRTVVGKVLAGRGPLPALGGGGYVLSGDTTNTSTNLTNVVYLYGTPANGDFIVGTNIPAGATIVSGAGTGTIVLSAAATGTAAGTQIAGVASQFAAPILPLDGLMGVDEFSIECAVYAFGKDITTIGSTYFWWVASASDASAQTLYLQVNGTALTAQLDVGESNMVGGSARSLTATASGFALGDHPANTWRNYVVSFDGSTLKVIVGNNTRSGSSAAMPSPSWLVRPWTGDPRLNGGVFVCSDKVFLTTTRPIAVADLTFNRYARHVYNEQRMRPQRGVEVDAATAGVAWTGKLAAVTSQYSGWARAESKEGATGTLTTVSGSKVATTLATTTGTFTAGAIITGTGIPANTEIITIDGTKVYLSKAMTASAALVAVTADISLMRSAQLDTIQSAGCKYVRVAELHERAVPTVSGGAITGIDYTGLDAHLDRFSSRGLKCFFHVGYSPVAFGGTTTGNVPPTAAATGAANQAAAFALYASYMSQVFQHIKARYGVSFVAGISFWNEPDLTGFWNGDTTTQQLKDLWTAVATQMNTDFAADFASGWPKLGGPDSNYSTGGSNTVPSGSPGGNTRGISTAAQAIPHVLGSAHLHNYTGSRYQVLETGKALRKQLDSQGHTTTPIRVTEAMLVIGAGQAARITNQRYSPWLYRSTRAAAYMHSLVAELARDPDGSLFDSAVLFRLGQQGSYAPGSASEEDLGMMAARVLPRPNPIFAAYQALWKHSGNLVTVAPSFPDVQAIATKSSGGVITVSYSSYRLWKPDEVRSFQLAMAGLPSTFTWKQWRRDFQDQDIYGDGRLVLVSQGDQTNLPYGVSLSNLGVGCIQITP